MSATFAMTIQIMTVFRTVLVNGEARLLRMTVVNAVAITQPANKTAPVYGAVRPLKIAPVNAAELRSRTALESATDLR
tara:strand:- start:167 stop:400 length:234 start_codon:yes stop_codon:yes gene_type:complete